MLFKKKVVPSVAPETVGVCDKCGHAYTKDRLKVVIDYQSWGPREYRKHEKVLCNDCSPNYDIKVKGYLMKFETIKVDKVTEDFPFPIGLPCQEPNDYFEWDTYRKYHEERYLKGIEGADQHYGYRQNYGYYRTDRMTEAEHIKWAKIERQKQNTEFLRIREEMIKTLQGQVKQRKDFIKKQKEAEKDEV